MYSSHDRARVPANYTGGRMRKVDILLFSEPDGGLAPFTHGELQVNFHKNLNPAAIPLVEGALWAFVDWILPDISGLEMCRRLRCNPQTAQAHITMILEEEDAEARRRALSAGADDYLVGPPTRVGILDRVLSLKMSEFPNGVQSTLRLGELSIELAGFQARWRAKAIPLAPNEFRLLRYFVEHPGRVFTRSQLISALGKQESPIDERTVDVWVGRLRRALKASGAGDLLRTVRSLGYVLDPP